MKVLFFSSSIGSGHDQVAKTLATELKGKVEEVQILDIIKTISPFLSRVMLESYLRLLKYAPGIWGLLHDQFSQPKEISDPLELVNKILAQEVRERINHFNPDLIVNTYALGSTIVGLLKRSKKISIPSATVITDYNLHSYWIDRDINRFFVASSFLKDILVDYGINKENIKAYGIPVRNEFIETSKKEIPLLKKELNLDNKPTLLFMGGGLGLGDILNVVKQADRYIMDAQFIIACGKNKELLKKANQINTNSTVIPLPFVNNISKYMKCSDIIVTKPGGITVTEAMVLGKPLALISPIPGQERHNENYLLNQGVAVSLPSSNYAGIILSSLIKNQKRLNVMTQLQSLITNTNSTNDIANDLLKLAKAKS